MCRPDVALVSPYPAPGKTAAPSSGVAPYTADLVRHLADGGARVIVVAPRREDAPLQQTDDEVEIRRAFSPGPVAGLAAMVAAVATGAPVVHVQHEHFLYGGPETVPGMLAGLAYLRRRPRPRRRLSKKRRYSPLFAQSARASLVVTLHQVVTPGTVDSGFVHLHRVAVPAPLARAGLGAVQVAVSKIADRVVVHERRFAEMVPGARLIPHGVNMPAPRDRARDRAALGVDGRFVVLCFGFVAPYKGLELVIDATKFVNDPIELVIAGGEHPRMIGDGYAGRLEERGAGRARFTGFVPDDDVAKWFSAADVVLFPYPRPHASSGALALALAHRTPFLLSPALARVVGAPPSTVAPTEPRALGARLGELAAHHHHADALRAACDTLSGGRSWPEVARRHLDLYEEVTSGRDPARRAVRPA